MYKQHYLYLYEKPKQGTSSIDRFAVYNYRHSINAIGGFDTMSCDIALRSVDEMQSFLDQYIGNMVRIFVDNPVEPIWEGYINRMTFSAYGTEYTISLDDMANRLNVQYTTLVSTPAPLVQTAVNDTNSQAIFGIKTEQADLGFQAGIGTAITGIINTRLTQKAWPKTSRIPGGGSRGLLHIECLGFFHTLEWEVFSSTASAGVTINALFNTLLGAVANTTTFFDNSVTSGISADARTINSQKVRGDSIWDVMRELAEYGDATNYNVIGLTPTSFSVGTRTFYYRTFNSTINYTARQSDGLVIRNVYGQKVDPWRVQPDNGVRISDMLVGWNGVGDNPTETWIAAIDYDANRQLATWRGDDDISAEGVFQFRHWSKQINSKRLGATRRFN